MKCAWDVTLDVCTEGGQEVTGKAAVQSWGCFSWDARWDHSIFKAYSSFQFLV